MERHEYSRRQVVGGLSVAMLAGAVLYATGCTSHTPERAAPWTTAYLPTWLKNDAYDQISARLQAATHPLDRIHLAFVEPDTEVDGLGLALTAGLQRYISSLPKTTTLSLAIGGAKLDAASWQKFAGNLPGFKSSMSRLCGSLEDLLQRPIHLDLDCEAELSAATITALARALHQILPEGRTLSIAVPATYKLGRFNTKAGQLGDIIETYRIMTYDQSGPWDDRAGPIASGAWVDKAISTWVKKTGRAAKLEIGYPTYGYRFEGALRAGDPFTNHASNGDDAIIAFKDLSPGEVRDDLAQLTSEANKDGGWISCMSPAVIQRIHAQQRHRHPDIGGAFFWAMDSLTAAHLDAVT